MKNTVIFAIVGLLIGIGSAAHAEGDKPSKFKMKYCTLDESNMIKSPRGSYRKETCRDVCEKWWCTLAGHGQPTGKTRTSDDGNTECQCKYEI